MTCRRVVPGFQAVATVWLTLMPAFGSAQTPRPQAVPLTLTAAIERALAANQTIGAARLQRPVDVAGVAVAGQRPNPEIVYEWSKETPRQAVGATLPIELGGKRQRRLELANATVAVTDADLARVVAEVRNDVRRAYFEVVAADARVQIADDVRALAQRARDAANARVTSGDAPRSDLTQSDLALANSVNDLVAARGESAATRAELNLLLGQPAGEPITLADSLTAMPLPSEQDALALAATANTELQVLDRRIAEQAARVNLANSLVTPDIAAGGTFTYDAFPEFRFGWRATFGITLPILSSHKAGVRVEELTLTRLKAEREAAVARMRGGIAAALSRATAARDQMANYENTILPLAVEAEQQAQAAYTGGQTNLPTLVQALQIARDTRQRGLQAGLDYARALADLERAIGASLR
jgi:cobalt-zinc-cadmium efflux system outer membrane protein